MGEEGTCGSPEEPRAQGTKVSNCHRGSVRGEHLVERHRCLVTPRPCLHVPHSLTALQRGSSWLSTKGKKMQSCHPRTNLLRAEPLSDWNFCTTHTAAVQWPSGHPGPRPCPPRRPHLQHAPPDFLQLLGGLAAVQGPGQTLVGQL